MHLLLSHSVDPYLNLATEEFLLKNSNKSIIFLYRNQPCVVVGKHQNAMAEVNYRFVEENKIPVIRRISGGGTVYHDEGNINFTFLQNGEEGNLVNFRKHIAPVAEFLKQMGIPAKIGIRNDILIDGFKVSGNAEHIYRKRTLHHGTLLYSSTLTNLRNALHQEKQKYFDKAVKSVRSKVANIIDSILPGLDNDHFLYSLVDYLLNYYQASPVVLTNEDFAHIETSVNTKYKDWQWNFGYSPNYIFKNNIDHHPIALNIELHIEKGIITTSVVAGNLNPSVLNELNNSLIGQPHSFSALSKNKVISYLENFANIGSPEILWSFF